MKPEEKKLTIKQRKWIKEYIKSGNATDAAMKVYDCKNKDTAAVVGSENLSKLNIDDLMEQMGLTDVALLNIGAEGLVSERATITGERIPDYAVRHKYWETMLKLKKRFSADVQINTQVNVYPILGGKTSPDVHVDHSNKQTPEA